MQLVKWQDLVEGECTGIERSKGRFSEDAFFRGGRPGVRRVRMSGDEASGREVLGGRWCVPVGMLQKNLEVDVIRQQNLAV